METQATPVSPADLKAVFDLFRPDRLRCGKHGAFTSIPREVEAVCSPGANLAALSYRETFLNVLLTMGEPPFLAPWIHDGYPDKRLFEVAATFPMPMPDYTETQPRSFDLPGFIRQLEQTDAA